MAFAGPNGRGRGGKTSPDGRGATSLGKVLRRVGMNHDPGGGTFHRKDLNPNISPPSPQRSQRVANSHQAGKAFGLNCSGLLIQAFPRRRLGYREVLCVLCVLCGSTAFSGMNGAPCDCVLRASANCDHMGRSRRCRTPLTKTYPGEGGDGASARQPAGGPRADCRDGRAGQHISLPPRQGSESTCLRLGAARLPSRERSAGSGK